VSLWYQAPQSTFEPRDSRSIGWSQVPNRKAVLLDDDVQSPQHSTGGGTQLDLSNTLSFGAPRTNIQLDPTINFAQFGFENTQEMTFNQYQMISNMSFSEVLNQVENIYTILDSGNYEARITALEQWRASGFDSDGNLIVMRDWSFDGTTIKNEYSGFTVTGGLITAVDNTLPTGDTATTTCP